MVAKVAVAMARVRTMKVGVFIGVLLVGGRKRMRFWRADDDESMNELVMDAQMRRSRVGVVLRKLRLWTALTPALSHTR
jgi:hypothetical protein